MDCRQTDRRHPSSRTLDFLCLPRIPSSRFHQKTSHDPEARDSDTKNSCDCVVVRPDHGSDSGCDICGAADLEYAVSGIRNPGKGLLEIAWGKIH